MAPPESGPQAVFVTLEGEAAAAASQRSPGLASLELELRRALAVSGAGTLARSEPSGAGSFVIELNGEHAERLFLAVAPTLESTALCSGARVGIRSGGADVPARFFRLQPHRART